MALALLSSQGHLLLHKETEQNTKILTITLLTKSLVVIYHDKVVLYLSYRR